MPLNFEIDFIQPLLKDLRSGEFASAEDFANGVTKYYLQTIAKGAPIGIPPTLPSAASGTPVPVSTGPGDSYKAPFNEGSKVKFNRIIYNYFNAKELLIAQQSLQAKRKSLENTLRKAEYQAKLIKTGLRRIEDLKRQASLAPQHIKNVIEGIKVIYQNYVEQIQNVKASLVDVSKTDIDIDVNAEFRRLFKEESDALDGILNLDFSNIQQTLNSIRVAKEYFTQTRTVFGSDDETKAYVKRRISQVVSRISVLGATIVAPETLGSLIVDIEKTTDNLSESTLKVLGKARAASDSLAAIKFYTEPQIRQLEQQLRSKESNAKKTADKQLALSKKAIDKKIADIQQKKENRRGLGVSEKKKGFKNAAERIKTLQQENKDFIKAVKEDVKVVNSIISKTATLIQSGLAIESSLRDVVNSLQADLQEVQQVVDSIDNSTKQTDIINYVSDHGLRELSNTTLIETAIKTPTVSFFMLKKILEKNKVEYTQLYNQVQTLEEQFLELKSEFLTWKRIPPLQLKNTTSQRTLRESNNNEADYNILTVFKFLKSQNTKLRDFRKRLEQELSMMIRRQKERLIRIKEAVEIAAINALPVPTQTEDAKTRQQAAEEKKIAIQQYKQKLETVKKKASAATSLATSISQLTKNIADRDVSAAKNESILRKIADGKFEYFTIGVDPTSAVYKEQQASREAFKKKIELFHRMDTYVSILKALAQDAKGLPDKSTTLVDKLRDDAKTIQNSAQLTAEAYRTGNLNSISPGLGRIIIILDNLFNEQNNKPSDYIRVLKNIQAFTEGDLLAETFQATQVTQTLASIEKKYLFQTRKMLISILGLAETEDENSQDRLDILKRRVTESKQYEALYDLYKNLEEGKGSIIATTIQEIITLLKELEAFIKTQATDVFLRIQKQSKLELERLKKTHEDRLKSIAKKRFKNDLLPQTVAYNAATLAFWIGASWINSAGTTFQVLAVPAMKRLTKDGKIEGTEASIRELADNLKRQLSQMQGLYIPAPAVGIPPTTFKGYN